MRIFFFVIILFFSDGLIAQSICSQFFKLSCAEKTWTITHLFKAKKAFRITTQARKETHQVAEENTLDSFPHGGKLDAFRHSFWMATLTQKNGSRAARRLGKAHERGNYRSFKRGKSEDGQLQDATAVEMDLFNNEIGIQIGKENPSDTHESIKIKIFDAIQEGKLKIMKRTPLGLLCNCDGHPIDTINRTKSDWKLPYCLIPSH